MKLLGIAIVGKGNEPLYLCDCARIASSRGSSTHESTTDDSDSKDYFEFGLLSAPASTPQGQSLSMEHQMLFHASLDRLEERIGASKPDGSMPLRKSVNNFSAWLGLLTVLDGEYGVYGHVSATNIKFLALCTEEASDYDATPQHQWSPPFGFSLKPAVRSSSSSVNDSQRRNSPEVKVKRLLGALHQHYIEYIMNPFCEPGEPIQSTKFDKNVTREIAQYYDLEDDDDDDDIDNQETAQRAEGLSQKALAAS